MSPATLDTYSSSVRCLDRFLASAGLPQSAPKLREHVEAFITDLLGKWSPATTENRALRPGSNLAVVTTRIGLLPESP